jgi:hypothetical protein
VVADATNRRARQHELSSDVGVLWARNGAMLQYLHFRVALEALNIAFLSIYTLEMALKLLGLGVREYLARGSNLMDAAIVGAGLYEFYPVIVLFLCFLQAAEDFEPTDNYVVPCVENSAALTVLRAFRLV